MEYVTTIHSLKDIDILTNTDAYLLNHSFFSTPSQQNFTLTNLKKAILKIHKLKKKAYVLVNKIFFDTELEKLKCFLITLKGINVDSIYYADFAVYELAKEYHMEHLLVFYHETFARSSYDIQTYLSFSEQKVIISKDATFENIQKLNNKEKLGLLFFGYFPIYYSKRKVITNQKNIYHLPISTKEIYQLKEEKRDELHFCIENKNGTIIYHHTPLSYYPYLEQLQQYVSTFIIDSLFFPLQSINEFIAICQKKSKKSFSDVFKNQKFTDGFLFHNVGVK